MQPIIIKYSYGKINIEVKEFNQEIYLSKNQKLHGSSCIVNNTCWHEDIHQTIKLRESNYYLMSKNEFVNIEEPTLTTYYKNNTFIIQIVNVSTNIKQTKTIEKSQADTLVTTQKQRARRQLLKSENKNVSPKQIKTKDKITVAF